MLATDLFKASKRLGKEPSGGGGAIELAEHVTRAHPSDHTLMMMSRRGYCLPCRAAGRKSKGTTTRKAKKGDYFAVKEDLERIRRGDNTIVIHGSIRFAMF